MIDYAKLMAQASVLRKRLGEDDSSPIDIFSLVQELEGLTLVYYPMGEKLSGMCIKGQKGNNLIAINSAMTIGRQRFSMAHELYHLFFDNCMMSVCGKRLNYGKEVEQSADMFASYFLMPEAALIAFAGRIIENRHSDDDTGRSNSTKSAVETQLTLDDVIRIEQYFGISHQAAVYRLMHTSYLSNDEGTRLLNMSVRRRAEALGYSPALYLPLPADKQYMTYGHYVKQAERLMERELVSCGKYEELLLDAFRADLVYGDDEEAGDVID